MFERSLQPLTLCKDQDIRLDARVLSSPPLSGASNTTLHLVGNEQDAMFIANIAQALHEGRWDGDVTSLTEYGLQDDGCRIARRRLLRQRESELVQRLRDKLRDGR